MGEPVNNPKALLDWFDRLAGLDKVGLQVSEDRQAMETTGAVAFRSGLNRFFGVSKSTDDSRRNSETLQFLLNEIENHLGQEVLDKVKGSVLRLPGDGDNFTVTQRIDRGTYVSSRLIGELKRLTEKAVAEVEVTHAFGEGDVHKVLSELASPFELESTEYGNLLALHKHLMDGTGSWREQALAGLKQALQDEVTARARSGAPMTPTEIWNSAKQHVTQVMLPGFLAMTELGERGAYSVDVFFHGGPPEDKVHSFKGVYGQVVAQLPLDCPVEGVDQEAWGAFRRHLQDGNSLWRDGAIAALKQLVVDDLGERVKSGETIAKGARRECVMRHVTGELLTNFLGIWQRTGEAPPPQPRRPRGDVSFYNDVLRQLPGKPPVDGVDSGIWRAFRDHLLNGASSWRQRSFERLHTSLLEEAERRAKDGGRLTPLDIAERARTFVIGLLPDFVEFRDGRNLITARERIGSLTPQQIAESVEKWARQHGVDRRADVRQLIEELRQGHGDVEVIRQKMFEKVELMNGRQLDEAMVGDLLDDELLLELLEQRLPAPQNPGEPGSLDMLDELAGMDGRALRLSNDGRRFVPDNDMSERSGLHRLFGAGKPPKDVVENKLALKVILGYIQRNVHPLVYHQLLDSELRLGGDRDGTHYTVRDRLERGTYVTPKLVAELSRLTRELIEDTDID